MDQNEMDAASASAWLDWWKRIKTVLDLEAETEIVVPPDVAQLAQERENARYKEIGNAATNCAIKFLRWAGKSATRRKDKNSRAALGPRNTVCVHCSSNTYPNRSISAANRVRTNSRSSSS